MCVTGAGESILMSAHIHHHSEIADRNGLQRIVVSRGHRRRTWLNANIGNDAEGAAVVASILDFEIGAGALVGGVENRRGQQFGVGEDVGNENSDVGRRSFGREIEYAEHKALSICEQSEGVC